ncbi:MAG: 1-acyl-sn-glycerol-3-phosphate acyltransferase [Deltaproteobacteria bacterium]|nr:MAG: 1-acyl-sn-glycerol-3-phosphate acyltransferase [Deltaproteobacteria bacterium]
MKSSPQIQEGIITGGQPNPVARLFIGLLSPFFTRIRFDRPKAKELSDLSRQATVIYVMHGHSALDFLYFTYLYRREGLPVPHFANELSPFYYGSLTCYFRYLGDRLRGYLLPPGKNPNGRELIRESTRKGLSSLVFLKRPRSLLRRNRVMTNGLMEELFELQQNSQRPITLIPQIILWHRQPQKVSPSIIDILFGETDLPGRLRKTYLFFRNYRRAFVRLGEPLDLGSVREKVNPPSTAEVASQVKDQLDHYFEREKQVINGPPQEPKSKTIKGILSHSRFRSELTALARQEGKSYQEMEKKASRILNEIAADYSQGYIAFQSWLYTRVWNRIYAGIEVDEKGLKKVGDAARQAPVILVPTHRSHSDYLLISHLFYLRDLVPPHIAAGINLSFWPVGRIFRGSGAFFIRRSFQGDGLYSMVLEHYLHYLLRKGYNQEFFIEGTRSRTGKHLQPKLGLLSTYLKLFAQGASDDLHFVPISISYEKILEEQSHARELEGGEKAKESVWELSKTRNILRRKHGRVYIQFDDPISLKRYQQEACPKPLNRMDPEELRECTLRLANKISYGMNKVTTVTSPALVATALLAHPKRGILYSELIRKVETLMGYLRYRGEVRFSDSLNNLPRAVDETLGFFKQNKDIEEVVREEERILSVKEDKRIVIDYYKNNIIHFFVTTAFLASSVLSFREKEVELNETHRRFFFLKDLLELEFIYRNKISEEEYFQQILNYFLNGGILEKLPGNGGKLRLTEKKPVLELFRMLIFNFIESYYLVLEAAAKLGDKEREEKDFLKQVLERGKRLYDVGDLQRRESLSLPILITAIKCYRNRGIFSSPGIDELKRKKPKSPPLRLTNDRSRRMLIRQIREFLD